MIIRAALLISLAACGNSVSSEFGPDAAPLTDAASADARQPGELVPVVVRTLERCSIATIATGPSAGASVAVDTNNISHVAFMSAGKLKVGRAEAGAFRVVEIAPVNMMKPRTDIASNAGVEVIGFSSGLPGFSQTAIATNRSGAFVTTDITQAYGATMVESRFALDADAVPTWLVSSGPSVDVMRCPGEVCSPPVTLFSQPAQRVPDNLDLQRPAGGVLAATWTEYANSGLVTLQSNIGNNASSTEVVQGGHQATSFTFDGAQPVFATADNYGTLFHDRLRVARKPGATWIFEEVPLPTTPRDILHTSIGVGPQHVVDVVMDAQGLGVVYVTNRSGAWHALTLATQSFARFPRLQIDAAGAARIVWGDADGLHEATCN
jgi:hypothetical protein